MIFNRQAYIWFFCVENLVWLSSEKIKIFKVSSLINMVIIYFRFLRFRLVSSMWGFVFFRKTWQFSWIISSFINWDVCISGASEAAAAAELIATAVVEDILSVPPGQSGPPAARGPPADTFTTPDVTMPTVAPNAPVVEHHPVSSFSGG